MIFFLYFFTSSLDTSCLNASLFLVLTVLNLLSYQSQTIQDPKLAINMTYPSVSFESLKIFQDPKLAINMKYPSVSFESPKTFQDPKLAISMKYPSVSFESPKCCKW